MRGIKFRGMSISSEWQIGNLAILKEDLPNAKAGYYISNSVGVPFAYQVRPNTVGQYTGWKDKKRRKIYEGDIVKYKIRKINPAGVQPENLTIFIKEVKCYDLSLTDPLSILNSNERKTLEVIGNIFENPELATVEM